MCLRKHSARHHQALGFALEVTGSQLFPQWVDLDLSKLFENPRHKID